MAEKGEQKAHICPIAPIFENGYYSSSMDSGTLAARRFGMNCYLAGIFFPIIYLTTEPYKNDTFIRFHSFQSIVFTLTWAGLTIVNNFIHLPKRISETLSILWLFFFVTWVVLMFKARRGHRFKLPIIGNLAERRAEQTQPIS